ncbi:MAG TPA: hypothetical protein VK009_18240 [Chloroflexota bacterium]|nr:hypothetical protein [Chloroflexota bacterium]
MRRRLRLLISVLSFLGLAAIGILAAQPHYAHVVPTKLNGQTAGALRLTLSERAPQSDAPTAPASRLAGTASVPAAAVFLYPQRGYPDGHGGVARSDQVYEVYRLSNGDYWLRVASTSLPPPLT